MDRKKVLSRKEVADYLENSWGNGEECAEVDKVIKRKKLLGAAMWYFLGFFYLACCILGFWSIHGKGI